MSDEAPLPKPVTSYLKTARDQIVTCIDAWGEEWWESETIGHAGQVTLEFLRREGALAPRSVVTAINARASRISGGKSIQLLVTWQWFIVVDGVIADRTDDGLILAGEGLRLVLASPWIDVDDSAFSKMPVAETPRMRSLYEDKDEEMGLSIWGIQWDQAIELGTARRATDPAPVPLAHITGTDVIDGGETADVEVDTEIE